MSALRILYLTAGTVGAGHVMRGLAIHRALERHGGSGVFTLASPRLDLSSDLTGDATGPLRLERRTIRIDSRRVADRDQALASDAATLTRELTPDLVLVDLFWVPFLHVVRACPAPAWLLLRRCPPRWLRGPPSVPFDAHAFARVIWTEPCAAGALEGASRVEPIVIASRDDERRGPSLRERLGVLDPRPLALVAHGGMAGEIEHLDALARARFGSTHTIAHANLRVAGVPFPLAPWLCEADVIVGGAGYNLAWELTWLERHEHASLVPFDRPIDDQHTRALVAPRHPMRANGADQLASQILGVRA
ncbi:MAG: hypothetical protein J0L92_21010 [Deltaproteobacteria bacterium]|nr:hypothetical protein [Deltaproteobacteria bacterium]